MKGYKIDYTTNTVTVSKKFLKDAGIIGTDAYNEMRILREMGLRILTKAAKPRPKRNITYKQMLDYMAVVENSEHYLVQFAAVRMEAQSKRDSYKRVVTWFEQTFPHFYDMPEFNEQNKVIVTPVHCLEEADDIKVVA